MKRPGLGFGVRHVAIYVRDLAACEAFYVDLLGMDVEWRPDDRNIYLTSGGDNLALHQAETNQQRDEATQRLDHIGIMVASSERVDEWFQWMKEHDVAVRTEPKTHRDGARSFYCYDPDGTLLQFIHHPPVSDWEKLRGIN